MNSMFDRFSSLLEKNNISPYKLCKDTGINQTSISHWKYGRSLPGVDSLQKIADYFKVSIDYLVNGDEKKDQESA